MLHSNKDDALQTTANGGQVKIPSIIMRTNRRTIKYELMDKRKQLRINAHPDYPNVAIYEDVTPLRSRMLYALRNRRDQHGNKYYKFTWTREGRIYCRTEEESRTLQPNGKQARPHVVNRPQDLAKLGFSKQEIENIIYNRRT